MAYTLEERARRLRDQADKLEERAALVDSFGEDDEYPNESVILFKRTFHYDTSRWRVFDGYTYVAVKVSNGFWYITGMTSGQRLRWEDLVEEYLVKAQQETGEVWFAVKWERI